MIKSVYGTKDVLPGEIHYWNFIEQHVRRIFTAFNYSEIRTPIFEETALFSRGIGENTDIVGKEMYTFRDRGELSITLKPEMTASVMRSVIEHSVLAVHPLAKLFYISPMFRQERPQAGRLRQFHQFGAEALGSSSPILDSEMIVMAYRILKNLGVQNLTLKINSLGTPAERIAYKDVLKEFLSDKIQHLSDESKKRYSTNILRIFDSKDQNDQAIMRDAPLLSNYFTEETQIKFELVLNILKKEEIPFELDHALVRGLDYYTHTTFEIVSGSVGSQSALCGGGRYDGLAEQLGSKPISGVGFAAGMERIILALQNENTLPSQEERIEVYLVQISKDAKVAELTIQLANALRLRGIPTEFDYSERSVKAQMREANKLNVRSVLFIGGDEFLRNSATLKNMSDGTQVEIPLENITAYILENFRG